MRPIRTLIVIGLVLATAVPAHAGVLERDPVEVEPWQLRVGDALRYEARAVMTNAEGESSEEAATTVVLVEGPATAMDRFGIARDADAFLVRVEASPREAEDEPRVEMQRCFALAGDVATVRVDHIESASRGGYVSTAYSGPLGVSLRGFEQSTETTLLASFPVGACPGRVALPPGRISEGDTLPLADVVLPAALVGDVEVTSRPAESTTFHGRDALRVVYDLDLDVRSLRYVGILEAVVADGLPGFVRLTLDARIIIPERDEESVTAWCNLLMLPDACGASVDTERVPAIETHVTSAIELAGFEGGDGPPLAPLPGRGLPEVHPDATFVPYGGFGFDDSALGLAYSMLDAVSAVRSDPTTGVESWLAERPGAALVYAAYDRRMRAPDLEDAETDGGWELLFMDGPEGYFVQSVRVTGLATPTGVFATPVKVVRNANHGGPLHLSVSAGIGIVPPTVVPDGASLARLIAAHGIAEGAVERFSFASFRSVDGPRAWFHASDVSGEVPAESASSEGLALLVDGSRNAATLVSATRASRTETSILNPFPPVASVDDDSDAFSFASIVGPAPGAGLAGGAAAVGALGALALALKFLVLPFYTRLRRDRLLDNEVRARIFEHVRASPGAHLAELADLTAIGEGATRHHVRELVRHKLLLETRERGFVRYFCMGEVPPALARREAVLRAGSNRRVFEIFRDEPHLSLRDAAARLGMSAPSVHRVLKRLRKEGILPAAGTEDALVTPRA